MNKTLLCTLLAVTAGAAQAAGPSSAAWSLLGDVTNVAGTLTLTTAYSDELPGNLSGSPAAFIDDIETMAALPAYALDVGDEPAYEGSLIGQSFDVQPGDVITLRWQFSTDETLFQDQAFVVINGQLITLATRGGAPVGEQVFSHHFNFAGTTSIYFGVVDTGDFIGVSTLKVSDLQFAPVPEPATWALWLGGAGLLGAWRRRTRP